MASNSDPFEIGFNPLKLPLSHRQVVIVNKKSGILVTAINICSQAADNMK